MGCLDGGKEYVECSQCDARCPIELEQMLFHYTEKGLCPYCEECRKLGIEPIRWRRKKRS